MSRLGYKKNREQAAAAAKRTYQERKRTERSWAIEVAPAPKHLVSDVRRPDVWRANEGQRCFSCERYSKKEWVDGLPGGHSLRGAERPHNGGREEQQARGAEAQRFAAREQDTRSKE